MALPGADEGDRYPRFGLALLVVEPSARAVISSAARFASSSRPRSDKARLSWPRISARTRSGLRARRSAVRMSSIDPGSSACWRSMARRSSSDARRPGSPDVAEFAEGGLHQRQPTFWLGGRSGRRQRQARSSRRGRCRCAPRLLAPGPTAAGPAPASASARRRRSGLAAVAAAAQAARSACSCSFALHQCSASRTWAMPSPSSAGPASSVRRTPVRPGHARRAAGPPGRPAGSDHAGSSSPRGRRPSRWRRPRAAARRPAPHHRARSPRPAARGRRGRRRRRRHAAPAGSARAAPSPRPSS